MNWTPHAAVMFKGLEQMGRGNCIGHYFKQIFQLGPKWLILWVELTIYLTIYLVGLWEENHWMSIITGIANKGEVWDSSGHTICYYGSWLGQHVKQFTITLPGNSSLPSLSHVSTRQQLQLMTQGEAECPCGRTSVIRIVELNWHAGRGGSMQCVPNVTMSQINDIIVLVM